MSSAIAGIVQGLNDQDKRLIELIKLMDERHKLQFAEIEKRLDAAMDVIKEMKPLLEYMRLQKEQQEAEALAKQLKGDGDNPA